MTAPPRADDSAACIQPCDEPGQCRTNQGLGHAFRERQFAHSGGVTSCRAWLIASARAPADRGSSGEQRAPCSAISRSTTARCFANRCGDPGTGLAVDTRLKRRGGRCPYRAAHGRQWRPPWGMKRGVRAHAAREPVVVRRADRAVAQVVALNTKFPPLAAAHKSRGSCRGVGFTLRTGYAPAPSPIDALDAGGCARATRGRS